MQAAVRTSRVDQTSTKRELLGHFLLSKKNNKVKTKLTLRRDFIYSIYFADVTIILCNTKRFWCCVFIYLDFVLLFFFFRFKMLDVDLNEYLCLLNFLGVLTNTSLSLLFNHYRIASHQPSQVHYIY